MSKYMVRHCPERPPSNTRSEADPGFVALECYVADNGSTIGYFGDAVSDSRKSRVAFIPGIGSGVVSVGDLASRFSERGHEVIVIDTRSRLLNLGKFATMSYYGELVADAAQEHFGDNKDFVLAGFSYGGFVAQEIAVKHPEQVESLVLLNTLAAGVLLHPPTLIEMARILMFVATFSDETLRKHAATVFGDDPELLKLYDMNIDVSRFAGVLQSAAMVNELLKTLIGQGPLPGLGEINKPTLIIGGDKDRIAPLPNSLELHKRISNSELEIIEGGGHMGPVTLVDQYERLMVGFFKRHKPIRDIKSSRKAKPTKVTQAVQ